MVLNGETARGDTTWADRTATRLLSARERNGGKERRDETSCFAQWKAVKRATRGDGPTKLYGCEGKRKPTVRQRGTRRARDGGRGGGEKEEDGQPFSYMRLNNIPISISEK